MQRVIDAFGMDQCLIFCRTNFDCDNLEKFLNQLGGPWLHLNLSFLLVISWLSASLHNLNCVLNGEVPQPPRWAGLLGYQDIIE